MTNKYIDYTIKAVLAILLVLFFLSLSDRINDNRVQQDKKYSQIIKKLQQDKIQLNIRISDNKLKIQQLQLKNKQLIDKMNNIKVYTDTLSSQQIIQFIDNFLNRENSYILK